MDKKGIKKWIVLAIIIVAYLAINAMSFEGLTIEGQRALALTIAVVLALMFELFPIAIVGILCVLLPPVLGIIPQAQAFQNFGTNAVFFIIATFIFAEGFNTTKIGYRITLYFVGLFGNKPNKVLLSYMLGTAIVSAVIADIPCAVIFSALCMDILKENNCEPGKSNFGKMIMIGIPTAAGIGGMATPAGSAINVASMSLLENLSGISISFLQWTLVATPLAFIVLIIAYFSIVAVFKPEITEVKGLENISERKRELGPMTRQQKLYAGTFAVVFVMWLTESVHGIPAWTTAAIASALLFMPGFDILDWKQIGKKINFSIPILVGGVNVLANCLASTKTTVWLGNTLFAGFDSLPVFVLLLIISVIGVYAHYIFPSSVAEVNVLTSVCYGLCLTSALSPVAMMLAINFTSHCKNVFPLGDPVALITYEYGYWNIKDMLKPTMIFGNIWIVLTPITVMLAELLNVI